MTVQDLEEWRKSRKEEDVWWIQIAGETLGRKVNLGRIEQILDENIDSEVMVLHVSQATQRPRPWVEVERVKAAPVEKPYDVGLGRQTKGAHSGEREPHPVRKIDVVRSPASQSSKSAPEEHQHSNDLPPLPPRHSTKGKLDLSDKKVSVNPPATSRRTGPRTRRTKKDNWFWSAESLGATFGAGVMCFIGALARPGSGLQDLTSSYGLANTFAATLGSFIGVILVTLVTTLIISGIILLFKKGSKNALPRLYPGGVLVFAGLAMVGNFVNRSIVSEIIESENKRQSTSSFEDAMPTKIDDTVGSDRVRQRSNFRSVSNTEASDEIDRFRTKNPPSPEGLKYYEVAGLTVKLPARPSRHSWNFPPEVENLMTTRESYQIKDGTMSIDITRAVYKLPKISLDGAADGSIYQVRNSSGVTGFKSTKESMTVDGLPGRKIQMSYTRIIENSRITINQYGLVIARDNESWHLQIIGAGSSHTEKLKTLVDEVFSSVRLT